MEVHQIAFAGSYPAESQCPKDEKPEYAFIGRSNVGKSSLINMLTGRKELARTSKKPGKTQLLNFFLVDGSWYLVDLPGYGYAKISKRKRRDWEKMIQGYLVKRATLQCAFVLIDGNIPPQKIDIEFVNWLGEMRVPFVLVFTKTDRPKPEQLEANIQAFRSALQEYWETLPPQFVTSSRSGAGRRELLDFIGQVNAETLDGE
jgi:GTP-binding protein